MNADSILELNDAIKLVTFKNAALHVNSETLTVQEYAKHLLEGGDAMEFVKKELDRRTPPREPELPKLKVIKTKPKRKKK